MNQTHIRTVLAPILLLASLTVLLTWPTAVTLTTHVVDRQDPLLNSWIMAWEARQLLISPLDLYDTNIFFPLENTLAFSEILLSTSAMVMPLQWLTGNALLSYNTAFLLSFFTTALGAYLLAFYVTGHRGAALVAGVAFAWSPYRMGHLSQVQLLAFGWLPLALIYLDRLLRGGGPGRRWVSDGLLFALFFLLQALASFYAALFSAMACALYLLGWLLWRRRLPASALAGGLLAAGLVALVMVPLSLPYFEVQRELGAGWTLEQNEQFSASLQAYGYAPEESYIWGAITRPLYYVYGPCCPPDSLFPGLTLLLLAAVALARGGGRRGLWLVTAGAAFVLSLGPTLTIRALEPTGISLPYRILWEWVPGFDAIRAPVRWAVLVTLALSMLAALGLARLRWRWAAPVALLLVLLEFSVAPLDLIPAPEAPASLEWLAAQPPTRVLELPLAAERPRPQVPDDQPRRAWELSRLLEMQYFSTEHWHTTPDGYSGYVPSRHGDFAREIAAFPSPRSVALLQGLGVRYVVVHEDNASNHLAARLAGELPGGMTEIERFDDESIFELASYSHTGLPVEALPVTTLPPEQSIQVPLVLSIPGGTYVPLAGETLALEADWQAADGREGTTQTIRVPWPLIIDEVALLPVVLRTPPAGEWTLTLSGAYPEGRSFTVEQAITIQAGAAEPPRLLAAEPVEVTVTGANTVTIAWTALQPISRYYSLSARLLNATGAVISQQDGPPGGDVPTIAWQPGERYVATWEFDLPAGTTVEDYQLVALWYDPEGGPPAHLWNAHEFVPELELLP